MAKAKITTYDNGATLIYQKDPNIKGYKVAMAFRGGAQFDGDYPGISHLVEHLFFRELNDLQSTKFLNNLSANTLLFNAYTKRDSIAWHFNFPREDIKKTLQTIIKKITTRKFNQEQILKELDVITHEFELHKTKIIETNNTTSDYIFDQLRANVAQPEVDLFGDLNKLKKIITPEIVQLYTQCMFSSENFMLSVVTNSPYKECAELFETSLLPHLKNAIMPQFISPYPDPDYYYPKNFLALEPNPEASGVEIKFYLRERACPSENTEWEIACDAIEALLLTQWGGIMQQKFRIEEPLSYYNELKNLNLGTSKFKAFTLNTNKAKLNHTIKKLCEMIREISETGFDRKTFNNVKKLLTESSKGNMIFNFSPDPIDNLECCLKGNPIVDFDAVKKYIETMDYDAFFSHISNIYKTARASLYVTGDFDSRKCYNLIEIEELLGKKENSKLKSYLSAPRYETTPMSLSEDEQYIWDTAVYDGKVNTPDAVNNDFERGAD